MTQLKIALAQTNPRVGDYSGNSARILEFIQQAANLKADLVVFGELALTGYPPGDLAYRSDVLSSAMDELAAVIAKSADYPELTIVLGHISTANSEGHWAKAQNSASVFRAGKLLGRYHKHELPNYDIFDDYRIFIPGNDELIFEVKGEKCAVMICEDIWRSDNRLENLRDAGVSMIVSPNGSPFEVGKYAKRLEVAKKLTSQGFDLAYVNLSGGQDDVVFDGASFVMSNTGEIQLQAPAFSEELVVSGSGQITEYPSKYSAIWHAISTGIRDYVRKTGNQKVVVGLSGGIDSALVAALAVSALGSENVIGVRMPSRFSSEHSLQDAKTLAENLKIDLRTQSIDLAHKAFEAELELNAIAGENIQARIRAVILMAISNNEAALVLNTGNKSEVAVGYSTIYGDSIGAYAPLKDLYKTEVWELAKWFNRENKQELIPANSITKDPSAELRPDQKDSDSLPNYQELDGILRLLIEEHATVSEAVAAGFSPDTVIRVDKMVRAAEWKRSQAAIGPRLSKVSFGKGRRVPIATKFGDLR